MGRLEGMTALVTGGGSGFGRGIVEAFAREGASTIVADIDGSKAAETVAALGESRARVQSTTVDVTDKASLEAAVEHALRTFGSLDIVVANAGIGQRPCSIDETTEDTIRKQFEVNSLGALLTCQAAIPALRGRSSSSILITVSGIALLPRPQLYGYGMAKAATLYLMKSLAQELAPERIRVNGLFPAVGDTPMLAEFAGGALTETTQSSFAEALPLGRLITADDVGHAAVFLSSPKEASMLTGCALPVDAGRCL